MDKAYLSWIGQIQKNKIDVTLRLAFVDWCNENGHKKAANRQRLAINTINKAYVIFTIQVVKFYTKELLFDEHVTEVYGYIQSGKNNNKRCFKLKNDGTLSFYTTGSGCYDGYKRHILKGSFKAYKQTQIDKERKRKAIEKSSQFAKFYGAFTGRYSGTGEPNQSAMPRDEGSMGSMPSMV